MLIKTGGIYPIVFIAAQAPDPIMPWQMTHFGPISFLL
jgi:hypothetical protein